jgi:hypothetical protein
MFINMPRITSVPGLASSASLVSLAIVLGFSIVIPFLATVVTYASVPGGGNNSLIFNGSSVGAVSLMFFVMVSFGSGGVTKCSPHDSAGTAFSFFLVVCIFWGLLYLIELAVFFRLSPLRSMWNTLTGQDQTQPGLPFEDNKDKVTGFFDSFHFTFWRIPGCALNMLIVFSTTWFCKTDLYFTVIITAITVGALHIPLIFSVNLDWFLVQEARPDIQIAEVVDHEKVNMHANDERLHHSFGMIHGPQQTPRQGVNMHERDGILHPALGKVQGPQQTPGSHSVFPPSKSSHPMGPAFGPFGSGNYHNIDLSIPPNNHGTKDTNQDQRPRSQGASMRHRI